MLDPNPLVAGAGAEYLRIKGVEVVLGVLEEECIELNRPFLKYITTSLPWVVMKAGVSLDGRIAYQRGRGGVITGPESLRQVHRLRNNTDAILVGVGTVIVDDPSLTTRLDETRSRDPVRIILDTSLRIDENARVLGLDSAAQTWIFCSAAADPAKAGRLESRGIIVHRIDNLKGQRLDLKEVLKIAAAGEITSILVEGGATVHGAFLNGKLVDRVHLFYAPIFAGDGGVSLVSGHEVHGGKEQAVHLSGMRTRRCGNDFVLTGDVVYP